MRVAPAGTDSIPLSARACVASTTRLKRRPRRATDRTELGSRGQAVPQSGVEHRHGLLVRLACRDVAQHAGHVLDHGAHALGRTGDGCLVQWTTSGRSPSRTDGFGARSTSPDVARRADVDPAIIDHPEPALARRTRSVSVADAHGTQQRRMTVGGRNPVATHSDPASSRDRRLYFAARAPAARRSIRCTMPPSVPTKFAMSIRRASRRLRFAALGDGSIVSTSRAPACRVRTSATRAASRVGCGCPPCRQSAPADPLPRTVTARKRRDRAARRPHVAATAQPLLHRVPATS